MITREEFALQLDAYIDEFYFKADYAFRHLVSSLSEGMALSELLDNFIDHTQVYDKWSVEISLITRLLQAQALLEDYPLTFICDAEHLKSASLDDIFKCVAVADYDSLATYARVGDSYAQLMVFDCAMRRDSLDADRDEIDRYMLSRVITPKDQHALIRLYVKEHNTVALRLLDTIDRYEYHEETLTVMACDSTLGERQVYARRRLNGIAIELQDDLLAEGMLELAPESIDWLLEDDLDNKRSDLVISNFKRLRKEDNTKFQQCVKQIIVYCYHHLQPLNEAVVSIMISLSDDLRGLFDVSQFAYYQDPDNKLKAFLYYSQLKKLDKHEAPQQVHIQMLALAKFAASKNNALRTIESLSMLSAIKGNEAAFAEAYAIAADPDSSSAVKKICFYFCMKQTMTNPFNYKNHQLLAVIANFFRHGIGCNQDHIAADHYIDLCHRLGGTHIAEALSLAPGFIEALMVIAKAGHHTPVRVLWKLSQSLESPFAVRLALMRCYAQGWGVRANPERVADMQAIWKIAAPVGTVDESKINFTAIVTYPHMRDQTRCYDASYYIHLMHQVKLSLMLIGVKKSVVRIFGFPVFSDGYIARLALGALLELIQHYAAEQLQPKQQRWVELVDDLRWSYSAVYHTASETEGDVLSRLSDGRVVSFNANWSTWISSHAIQYTFYKCRGEIYLNITNRGAAADEALCGVSIYKVADLTALSSKDKMRQFVQQCKKRGFCEQTNSSVADGIGHALGLTLIHQIEKSPQPSGTCAVASVQNAVLNHIAIKLMQSLYGTERPDDSELAELSRDTIDYCFGAANDNDYKPWRQAMRVRAIERLHELGDLPAGKGLHKIDYEAVMKLVKQHATDKQGSDVPASRDKGELLALHANQSAIFSAPSGESEVTDTVPPLLSRAFMPII